MEKRKEQAYWSRKLEEALGAGYKVRYDVCESGYTCIYKNGVCIHQVKNSEISGKINVYDYR